MITLRDQQLLAALDYAPLTARQLQRLSQTWGEPFGFARLVRERLLKLAAAKLVTAHPYAILQRGQPENYYLLTRDGYQLVHGHDAKPPTKGYCSPIALARQSHQQAISEFLVHTLCGAHRSRVRFSAYYRENTLRIEAGGDAVYPDASFLLCRGDEQFRFFLEMDTGSERVESRKKEADSIERKLRTYDAFQDRNLQTRFRVLFVTARDAAERLRHILALADRITRDPNRTLFYGITMARYLMTSFPVTSPLFLDRRGRRQSLVPDVSVASPRVDVPIASLIPSHLLNTATRA